MALTKYHIYSIKELRKALATARAIVKKYEPIEDIDPALADKLEYIFRFLTLIAGLSLPIDDIVYFEDGTDN